jgi:hypothetical protein
MSVEDASEKITAFMSKYGEKGFLTLYFSNYLYEMILSYLRAHSDTPSKDSVYEFHFGKSDEALKEIFEKVLETKWGAEA